jgi:predicted TIM-barrel fold metal-dependent hydrolase
MTGAAYPIVDVHQHTGPWPFAGKWGGIEQNLHYLACRSIDAAIISSGEAIVDDMLAGNRHLAEDLAGHGNLYAYVTVNPRYLDLSQREIETYRSDPRFVGFKIHTSYSATAMGEPRMADLFALLEGQGKPLLIHTWGAGAVRSLASLAQRFPRLPIIVAHAGGDAWREAIEAARDNANLYLDFALSSPERERIERAITALGPQRVMFGSDATLFDPLYMLSCFAEADIADRDRALVMGGNALRVFGLELPTVSPP